MALSNYFENKIIDFLFRGGEYTPPSILYVALCLEAPTAADTGSTIIEVSDGNYERMPIDSVNTQWYSTQGNIDYLSTGTSGITGNVNPIIWSTVTWSATIVAVAICDDAVGGNLIYFAQFDDGKDIGYGSNVNFDTNSLRLTFS